MPAITVEGKFPFLKIWLHNKISRVGNRQFPATESKFSRVGMLLFLMRNLKNTRLVKSSIPNYGKQTFHSGNPIIPNADFKKKTQGLWNRQIPSTESKLSRVGILLLPMRNLKNTRLVKSSIPNYGKQSFQSGNSKIPSVGNVCNPIGKTKITRLGKWLFPNYGHCATSQT